MGEDKLQIIYPRATGRFYSRYLDFSSAVSKSYSHLRYSQTSFFPHVCRQPACTLHVSFILLPLLLLLLLLIIIIIIIIISC